VSIPRNPQRHTTINVPAFSTIEMSLVVVSPGPGKSRCFHLLPALSPRMMAAGASLGLSFGDGGAAEGQRPFLCPSREKRTRARELADVVRDS